MTTATVTKLPQPQGADHADVPPFTISVASNFAQDQQVQIHMPVPDGLSREEAHRRVDLAVDLAQRQLSRAECRLLDMAIGDKQAALALQKDQKRQAVEDFAAEVAALQADIEIQMGKRAQIEQAAAAAHVASGRQSDFKPEGATASKLKAFDRAIEQLAAKVRDKQANQIEHVEKQHDVMITRLGQEIEAMRRQLERHRAIVAGA